MKLVFFFVCALAAFQGLEARSVEVAPIDVRGLGDIISGIQNALGRLVQIIADITAQIPIIAAGIVESIQQVVGQIGQVIGNIQDTIQEIVEQGEIAASCVESQRGQIEALIDFANQGLQNCVSAAEAETVELQDQVRELLARVQNLQNEIVNRTLTCVNNNQGRPIKLFFCLSAQVQPIAEEVEAVQAEVSNTIAAAQEAAVSAVNALGECSAQLQQDIVARQLELINNIRQCIDDNQSELKH